MTANRMQALTRLRWAVRATLTLGVAASVAANVLHADRNPISQTIAAWPPLALLLTVELISRVPAHRRSLAVLRLTATALIAGIAGWVSYWHMAAVAARYGETGATPYLLPASVDGLIIVASVCLIEIGNHIHHHTTTTTVDSRPSTVDIGATVDSGLSTVDSPSMSHPPTDREQAPPVAPASVVAPVGAPQPSGLVARPVAVPRLAPVITARPGTGGRGNGARSQDSL